MKKYLLPLTILTCGVVAQAQFTTPNTFSAGSTIKAADMNGNFDAVQTELRRLAGLSGAFLHTATAANISSGYITCFDNPLTNNAPNAIVIAAHSWTSTYYTKPFGMWYNGSKWCIYSQDTSQNITVGTKFNVMVFKP